MCQNKSAVHGGSKLSSSLRFPHSTRSQRFLKLHPGASQLKASDKLVAVFRHHSAEPGARRGERVRDVSGPTSDYSPWQ